MGPRLASSTKLQPSGKTTKIRFVASSARQEFTRYRGRKLVFRNFIIDYRARRLIQSSNITSFDGKIPATAHCSSILGTHTYGYMELHLPLTTRLSISVNRIESQEHYTKINSII